MNDAVYQFVESTVSSTPEISGPVLDVGSLDVNGTVRDIFSDRGRFPSYTGIDIREGPGVDLACDAHLVPVLFPDWESAFGVVVCTEMLEHDSAFWVSLDAFRYVLRDQGHLIATTRGIGYPRHDHPSDYWRFTAAGLRSALERAGFHVLACDAPEIDGEGMLGPHALATAL